MYDIAIIGAGPAGTTLARLLGDRYKILLVDRRQTTDRPGAESPAKCCGGLLAPDAQRMLSRFGLGLPRSVLVGPQIFVVRAVDIPRRLERYYQRFYINMDRGEFDCWLLSLVPPTADVRQGWRLKTYAAEDGAFRLEFDDKGRSVTETASVVVGADGAASRVEAGMPGRRPRPPDYFAVQEWVEADTMLPYFSALFDPEITDYYCWTIPKGDRLLIGAALPAKDRTAERFDLLKERLEGLGFRLGKTLRRESGFLRRPQSVAQLSAGGPGVALVGEAGGWVSPSSAEGFSYAFRTALALAEALRPGLAGFEDRYRRALRPLVWNIRAKQWKSRLIFNPALRAAAMRSGAQSIDPPIAALAASPVE